MTEYEFIELIKDIRHTEEGAQGVFDSEKAKETLKKWIDKGWRVHTVFPDAHGTCLLERTTKWWQR